MLPPGRLRREHSQVFMNFFAWLTSTLLHPYEFGSDTWLRSSMHRRWPPTKSPLEPSREWGGLRPQPRSLSRFTSPSVSACSIHQLSASTPHSLTTLVRQPIFRARRAGLLYSPIMSVNVEHLLINFSDSPGLRLSSHASAAAEWWWWWGWWSSPITPTHSPTRRPPPRSSVLLDDAAALFFDFVGRRRDSRGGAG